MDAKYNNEIHDLIYSVLDGEATGAEQKVLYDALSENPELQSEFNSALEINKSLSLDKLNLMPPPAVTESLFRKAGFANPSSIPAASNGSIASNIYNFVQKCASTAGAALIAASLTFTLYTNIDKVITTSYNKKASQITKNEIQKNNYPVSSSTNEKSNSNVSVIAGNSCSKYSKNNDNTGDSNSSQVLINKSNSAKSQMNNIIIEDESDDTYNEEISELNEMNQAQEQDVLRQRPNELTLGYMPAVNSKINSTLSSYPYENHYSQLPVQEYEKLNLSIEVRGISALNYYPSRTIESDNSGFNNLSLAVLYHFDENHSLGLSAGKENLQMYSIIPGKKRYSFDRESDIVFAGVSYKYNLGETEALFGINPYTDILFGGTKYGPLSKAGIGLSYNFNSNFTLSAGFEWTSLMYSELNTYKVTHKSGLVYKLSYSF